MCGRYTLILDISLLRERFRFEVGEDFTYVPRYNIAPSQPVLAVLSDGKRRRGGYLRWGLIPPWAKDPSIGHRMINARLETAAEKPAFREALRRKRCLIPADGFYEWKRTASGKVPVRCVLRSRRPFAFAGLWQTWRSPAGETVHSCTILTTRANERLAAIHDRMPVILPPDLEEAWLDPALREPDLFRELLQPYPEEELEVYEVNPLVNRAGIDTPECIAPAGRSQESARLSTGGGKAEDFAAGKDREEGSP